LSITGDRSQPAPHPWLTGSFLGELNAEQQGRILRLGTLRQYPTGAILIHHGDPTSHVFILIRGFVKIEAVDIHGQQVLLGLRGPGDVVGELAALTNENRTATIRTAAPVTAQVFTNDAFRSLLEETPISFALMKVLGNKLQAANDRRVRLSSQSVIPRLAAMISMLADDYGRPTDRGVVIEVSFSQAELASLIGGAEASVQKALRSLRSQGILDTGYRQLTITDREMLNEVAEGY
jgi:CRP-like cAMP-binding protein